MNGKGYRKKGLDFEREVAVALRGIFPNARRHLEVQIGENNGIDLDFTDPFKIQCKALNRVPNLPLVFSEFKGLTPTDIPVVAFKVTGRGSYAALRLQDLLKLLDARENKGNTSI